MNEIDETRAAKKKIAEIEAYCKARFDEMRERGYSFVLAVRMPGNATSVSAWGPAPEISKLASVTVSQVMGMMVKDLTRRMKVMLEHGIEPDAVDLADDENNYDR